MHLDISRARGFPMRKEASHSIGATTIRPDRQPRGDPGSCSGGPNFEITQSKTRQCESQIPEEAQAGAE